MGKRRKQIVSLLSGMCLTAAFLAGLSGCGKSNEEESVSRIGYALNTQIEITLYGTDDEQLITDCFKLCSDYEKKLSRTVEDSEILLLNENGEAVVSDETAELLEKGLYYGELSDGAFDITIEPISSLWDFTSGENKLPDAQAIQDHLQYVDYKNVKLEGNHVSLEDGMGIDLGAIAKGYIADRVKEYLVDQGVESATISLGGNVVCIGSKPSGDDFHLGIQNPESAPEREAKVSVLLSDQSLVTSGDYERYITVDGKKYHHILDPETGYSYDNGLASVTIISEKSVDGDGLSTTCFALGLEKGLDLINSIDDVWAIFIDQDGNVTYSEGCKEKFSCKEYQSVPVKYIRACLKKFRHAPFQGVSGKSRREVLKYFESMKYTEKIAENIRENKKLRRQPIDRVFY